MCMFTFLPPEINIQNAQLILERLGTITESEERFEIETGKITAALSGAVLIINQQLWGTVCTI